MGEFGSGPGVDRDWISNFIKEIGKPSNNLFVELPIFQTLFPNVKSRSKQQLKNFKIVGSYNWKDDSSPEKPIMVIPGEQGYIFEDQKLEQLNKEEYLYIEDKNLAEFPDYPLEPIYQSILQCTPDYEFENVDVILDRKILRIFLNFVENQEKDARNWKITDGFRLEFQRVGNSIVILNGIQGSKYICNDYAKDFEAKITKGRKGKFCFKIFILSK